MVRILNVGLLEWIFFLCLVGCYHNLHDEERDALALHLIQQDLDGSMLHKVATTISLKEVLA